MERKPSSTSRRCRLRQTLDQRAQMTDLERLRYETPLPMFERYVLENFDYHGTPLKRAPEVALLCIASNRDPRCWPGLSCNHCSACSSNVGPWLSPR